MFSLFLIVLYVGFNIYSYSLIRFYLIQNLDSKIGHEMDHISYAFRFEKDTVKLINPSEFEEIDLASISEDPYFLQIYTLDGELLLQSRNISQFGEIALSYPRFTENFYFNNISGNGSTLRSGYTKIFDEHGNHVAILQLSVPKNHFNSMLANVIEFNLLTAPFVLLIIILISIIISNRAFAPINKIITLANNISSANLNERVNYKADVDDVLGKLRDTLNNLFMRLDEQIKQIASFTDNASHQLMTPLTVLKTELEYLMRDGEENDATRQALLVMDEQTERMINMVNALLLLSKAEKDTLMQNSIFHLGSLVNKQIKKMFALERIKYIIDKEIYIRGREDYFSQVLFNLIDNAIKYSRENGDIEIIALINSKNIIITVADGGIGINDSEKEKIFERFYRCDKIENLEIRGYGLGLSLVKAIVTIMGGSITAKNNTPKGSVFIISLPLIDIK